MARAGGPAHAIFMPRSVATALSGVSSAVVLRGLLRRLDGPAPQPETNGSLT